MQDVKTILIVIPYFGRWPFWMPLFLKSCEFNPTVNWLLLGDCGEPDGLPANVAYRYSSFLDYCKEISSCLGIDFRPESPYKLCDLKPTYGMLHSADVEEYDFWGFGDIDLFYGDLRKVYTEKILNRYDLISNHATRVSGHLCLLKNTERMRLAFGRIPSWRQVLQDPRHQAVDEKAFSRLFVKHKNFPAWLREITNQLYPLVKDSCFSERFTTPNGYIPWKDGSRNYPLEWYWKEGRVWSSLDSESDDDYPYFHFFKWKEGFSGGGRIIEQDYILDLAKSESWKVTEKGFYFV